MIERTTHDVLVVGAGPAGLTAAVALARHGVDVLVVERHAGTSPFPKATGVSTRTMELLRGWGLEEQARAGAMRVRPFVVGVRHAGRPRAGHRVVQLPDRRAGARGQPDHPGLPARRTTSNRCCWRTCASAAARSGSTPS